MAYNCPVCEYDNIQEDPTHLTYEICPRCGVEYGNDEPEDYPALRAEWIAGGRKWWSKIPEEQHRSMANEHV